MEKQAIPALGFEKQWFELVGLQHQAFEVFGFGQVEDDGVIGGCAATREKPHTTMGVSGG